MCAYLCRTFRIGIFIVHRALPLETAVQLSNQVLVDERVDILSDLIQDEPIADQTLIGHILNRLHGDQPAPGSQEIEP